MRSECVSELLLSCGLRGQALQNEATAAAAAAGSSGSGGAAGGAGAAAGSKVSHLTKVRTDDEVRVAASIIDLFHLLPAAPPGNKFLEKLVPVTLALEQLLPGLNFHGAFGTSCCVSFELYRSVRLSFCFSARWCCTIVGSPPPFCRRLRDSGDLSVPQAAGALPRRGAAALSGVLPQAHRRPPARRAVSVRCALGRGR